jgi:hypothetical protein
MRRAEAPRKFALADALAHASPSSAEAARHVEARFQEFRGEVPPEGFAWLRDALLAVDEGESGLERAKSRWRDPRLDLTGIRRAAAALARLVAAGAAVAADVEAALVGVSACPGDGRRSLPEPGRPTLRSIDLWSHHADDRFRSLRVLLDLLGGFGPAAQATVPEIERVRRAESDERVAHVAARALRRIAAK